MYHKFCYYIYVLYVIFEATQTCKNRNRFFDELSNDVSHYKNWCNLRLVEIFNCKIVKTNSFQSAFRITVKSILHLQSTFKMPMRNLEFEIKMSVYIRLRNNPFITNNINAYVTCVMLFTTAQQDRAA